MNQPSNPEPRRGLLSFAAPQLFSVWLASSAFSLVGATLPADWQHDQSFNVGNAGLIKLSLPVATLDAARPALEDLRLYDDAGNEVPYLIERPVPVVKTIREVKSFQVSMQPRATVITIETGLRQPLDAVTLETPAPNFLKPVHIEGSVDGKNWQTLAQGQPIFRQPNGAGKIHVSFQSDVWAWLRLTVDDQRTAPIPFTGARVQATVIEKAPTEWMTATISERSENPGATRLALNLGGANQQIAGVQVETGEPLFARRVSLAVPQVSEDAIREQQIGQGSIYKIAVEGQPTSENLLVPLEAQVRSRELLVLIQNEDNPPLPISAVRIERRPVYLVFLSRQPGAFHLLTGNSRCAAPRYDLPLLGINLKTLAATPIQLATPMDNPNYRAPEVLPGIESGGVALDVSDWKFRKPVKLTRSGAQQLELDLEILSRAEPGFGDLRLVRDGKQIPYIVEHTSISRAVMPEVLMTNDATDRALSRWIIKLPQENLPVTRLRCTAKTSLFERTMILFEEIADERGEIVRRELGSAVWTQTPGRSSREFELTLAGSPQGSTLFLETRNGDNAPVELGSFEFFHPVTRVLFKADAGGDIFVYYGNPQAASPRYDLSLVADKLLAANKSAVTPGAQEQLKKSSRSETHRLGQGGVVFWGMLALVVVGLLLVISRLLPKSPETGSR